MSQGDQHRTLKGVPGDGTRDDPYEDRRGLLPRLPPGPARLRLAAIVSGLLASFCGCWLAEAASRGVRREPAIVAGGLTAQLPVGDPPQALAGIVRERVETCSGAIAMGVLGAVYGLSLGVAGGWSRGSMRSAKAAGTIGLLLGSAAGGATPFLAFPLFFRSIGRPPDPMLPLLIQVAVYGSLSGAAGLAFGIGQSGWRGAVRGLCAASMGSLLAIMLYNLLHTLLFPLEWDFSPLPVRPPARLAACVCVALISCVCLATVLVDASGKETDLVSEEAQDGFRGDATS